MSPYMWAGGCEFKPGPPFHFATATMAGRTSRPFSS